MNKVEFGSSLKTAGIQKQMIKVRNLLPDGYRKPNSVKLEVWHDFRLNANVTSHENINAILLTEVAKEYNKFKSTLILTNNILHSLRER